MSLPTILCWSHRKLACSDLQREKEAVNQQAQALKLRLKRTRERDRRALTSVALQVDRMLEIISIVLMKTPDRRRSVSKN